MFFRVKILFSAVFIAIHLVFPTGYTGDRVENLGIFAEERKEAVIGQDGCTPVPVRDNLYFWTFGDTILGEWKGNLSVSATFEETAEMDSMLSNSLAFSEKPGDTNAEDLRLTFYRENGEITEFIKLRPGEDPHRTRLWAIDGIRLNDAVFVFYIQVSVVKDRSGVPFSVDGTGISRWDMPKGWTPGDRVNFRRLGLLFRGDEPTFGDAVIIKNSHLYLIGHRKERDGSVNACIARVAPEKIARRNGYEFLSAEGKWTGEVSSAGGFFGDVMGELSLSHNGRLGEFSIIYCSKGGIIRYVGFSGFDDIGTARSRVVYVPERLKPVKSRPFLFYYSGKEVFHTEDNIYAVYIHPSIYQPILIRIPYAVVKKSGDAVFSGKN